MPSLVTKPNNRQLAFDNDRLGIYADRILDGLYTLSKERLLRGVTAKLRHDVVTGEEISSAFTMSALELVTKDEPDWKFAAARALLTTLYKKQRSTAVTKRIRKSPTVRSTISLPSWSKRASTAKNCSIAIRKSKSMSWAS